jgi:hypothetical protein
MWSYSVCWGEGNCKAAAVFGVDESNIRPWRKHKAVISGHEASRRKSVDPKKDDFLKLMMQSSRFFKRDARLDYFVIYDLLHVEAIKARYLNIPGSCFKISKGRAIRFMRRMGLVFHRRMTIYHKILNKTFWIISGTSPTWGRFRRV